MSEEFVTLLAAAREGDPQALLEIARQYEPKLRIVARVQLGPALRPYLDSVDLVQSVHRSLMVGLRDEKFDISSPDNLIALTLTMLRRKIARQWRRMRKQTRHDQGISDTSQMAQLLTELSAPPNDPLAEVAFREAVLTLCETLDPVDQQIIILRLEDYSAPEIATKLGLTPVNVRVRTTRLRQRLVSAGVLDDWL